MTCNFAWTSWQDFPRPWLGTGHTTLSDLTQPRRYNAHITLLWQRTGAGVGNGGSVAIGPSSDVYSAGNGVIWELDPATGTTLRSIPASVASGVTPALTNNVLWIIGESQVFAYDVLTLQFVARF